MLDGKTLLVTGGTGSFGRHFVREVLRRYALSSVVVYSRDEIKQFRLAQACADRRLRLIIGDVRDADALRDAMVGVNYVVHAAAQRHVLAAERDPLRCLEVNVHGTENVINAARACGVDRLIALSSDKAVSPVSVYGASKMTADKLVVAANGLPANRTRYAVIRCGNLVGARGSVVSLFRHLVAEGAESLPITDPRMTRFWLTPDMSVDCVLRSLERMQGGEIFVPRSPSVRIVDLAEAMAPGVPTHVVGRRAGEKLHEVMCPADESHLTLAFAEHFVVRPTLDFERWRIDYAVDGSGEQGQAVEDGFAYTSANNPQFLDADAIRDWNSASDAELRRS